MWIAAVLIVLLVLLILRCLGQEENPVDKLPGPPKLPIIGNAHQLLAIPTDNLLQTMKEYTKQLGDKYVFNILGIRVVHIVGPAEIEAIMSHSRNISKSFVYQFLSSWLGQGLLLSTGAHWHKRRKILTPTFHFNILKNFGTVMEEKCRDLVRMLRDKNGAEVDLMPVISDFTLYTICETAMGTKLDTDQSALTQEYKQAILRLGPILLKRSVRVWLFPEFIFKRSSLGRKYAKQLDIVRSFADKVIEERKGQRNVNEIEDVTSDDFGTKRRLAMLDLLLEAEAKGEIDMEGIRDEVNTFMFEGHDTTAVALVYSLMLLAEHEDVQNRVYEEIESILCGSDRALTISDQANMKYLEAVIKEILRLYPSVPIIGREADEDFMMGDLLVKKGTTFDIHIYELQHREDLFPEPEVFNPERFIDGALKHPYSYVPFSAGPRNCIGQRFAIQEMKFAISEIVRNFKLEPKVKGYKPRVMAEMVLRPIDPIYVKFLPR